VHESTRGRLLVATPSLLDPNFERTVVLVLEHSEDGALGVVLNRPTDTRLGEVLPGWGALAVDPGLVHMGGPVQTDGMIGLALLGSVDPVDVPGVRELWPGVGTVDLEDPTGAVEAFIRGVRCFVGYSGWGSEQLEDELATGSWFVVDRDPVDLWSPDPGGLWLRVLRRQPAAVAQYAHCPPDPSVN